MAKPAEAIDIMAAFYLAIGTRGTVIDCADNAREQDLGLLAEAFDHIAENLDRIAEIIHSNHPEVLCG